MQTSTVAIRLEDVSSERRCPLAPEHVPLLKQRGIDVVVQPSPTRIFDDAAFAKAGARIEQDLSPYPVICGIKEAQPRRLAAGRTYLFFSHTIKGQAQNMPLLRRLIELGCTLIDYERVTDSSGQRLLAFGRFAGIAGMIDTLWALGQRWRAQGHYTALERLRPAHRYPNAVVAKTAVADVGRQLRFGARRRHDRRPMIVGITGSGNASKGAQEVLQAFGAAQIEPSDVASIPASDSGSYWAVFEVDHMVCGWDGHFDRAEYFQYPYRYRSIFRPYLDHLSVLVNCIYWEPRYPRLVTRGDLRTLYARTDAPPALQVIGDISCDVRGAIEATLRPTWPDNPVYVYDVNAERTIDGLNGVGPAILAVYNLPSELPRDASTAFGDALVSLLPSVVAADFGRSLARSGLDQALQRATVVYGGNLTADYDYLRAYL